jgi:uncharacterized RDD family membrane protein YckC
VVFVLDNPMEEKDTNILETEVVHEKKKFVNDTNLPDNSKPHFMMRIAGGLIDLGCMALVTFGLYYLFTLTPMGNATRNYKTQIQLISDDYKVKELIDGSGETYGYKVHENEEAYKVYTTYVVHDPDETGYKYVVVDNKPVSNEVITAYTNAIKADKVINNYKFNIRLIEYGLTMLGGFIATSTFLLAIPLLNKRRATLGKMFAGSMLVHNRYYTPAKWYQVVGRFSFQYLIEGALPYLFLGYYAIPVVPVVLFIISLISRKSGRTLHDYVSVTKVIDKRTNVPLGEQ